jgi:hypothetical protein
MTDTVTEHATEHATETGGRSIATNDRLAGLAARRAATAASRPGQRSFAQSPAAASKIATVGISTTAMLAMMAGLAIADRRPAPPQLVQALPLTVRPDPAAVAAVVPAPTPVDATLPPLIATPSDVTTAPPAAVTTGPTTPPTTPPAPQPVAVPVAIDLAVPAPPPPQAPAPAPQAQSSGTS